MKKIFQYLGLIVLCGGIVDIDLSAQKKKPSKRSRSRYSDDSSSVGGGSSSTTSTDRKHKQISKEEALEIDQKGRATTAERAALQRFNRSERLKVFKPGPVILNTPLDTSRDYPTDDNCFVQDTDPLTGALMPITPNVMTTQNWVVLVNTHTSDLLYESGTFDRKRHRSLNWAAPYDFSTKYLKNQENIHESLALPLDWSRGDLRSYVTFIVLQPRTQLEFKIGYVKPAVSGADSRMGHGVQVRLKGLPAGTILLTMPLFGENKKDLAKSKGHRNINLISLFKQAIEEYNAMHKGFEIPIELVNPSEAKTEEEMIGAFMEQFR